MGQNLYEQAPAEYFKDLVEDALARQHLRASGITSYYLSNLLCRFVGVESTPAFDNQPLALRLMRALESGGSQQRNLLRGVGDSTLFVTGFFSDSLNSKAVGIDYYITMGEYAYGSLSECDGESYCEVFAELSKKFVRFMDVLSDVSEHTGFATNTDILRLYEKWLRTGSPRDGRRLVGSGITPNTSIGWKFIQ